MTKVALSSLRENTVAFVTKATLSFPTLFPA